MGSCCGSCFPLSLQESETVPRGRGGSPSPSGEDGQFLKYGLFLTRAKGSVYHPPPKIWFTTDPSAQHVLHISIHPDSSSPSKASRNSRMASTHASAKMPAALKRLLRGGPAGPSICSSPEVRTLNTFGQEREMSTSPTRADCLQCVHCPHLAFSLSLPTFFLGPLHLDPSAPRLW